MASEEADGRCERLLCDRWARGQVAAMKKSFDRKAPTEPGGLPPGETRPYIKPASTGSHSGDETVLEIHGHTVQCTRLHKLLYPAGLRRFSSHTSATGPSRSSDIPMAYRRSVPEKMLRISRRNEWSDSRFRGTPAARRSITS